MANSNNTGTILTTLVVGAAAGAIAGILLAPDSGEKTRKKLSKQAKKLKKEARRTAEDIRDKAEEQINNVTKNVKETAQTVANGVK